MYNELVDFRRSRKRNKKEKRKKWLIFTGCCFLLVGGVAIGLGTLGLSLPVALCCGSVAERVTMPELLE